MKKCCVECKGESDGSDSWGGPDPCLGLIPGVTFACCGHGWLVAHEETGKLIDRCYVFAQGHSFGSPYDDDSFYLSGHEARLWFRAMGLTVPDPEKLQLDSVC